MKNFKFIYKENWLANVIRFSIETIQAMEFCKTSIHFVGQNFPQKQILFFQWKQLKIKFSLTFCFASSDSLKAVTGCFQKLEVSAKRFGLKKRFELVLLNSSIHFKYIDVKPIFGRSLACFDRFFLFCAKKILFEAKHLCFKFFLVRFILPLNDI